MKIVAVIVAAGSSGRMQNEVPKVFLPLCGKTVIRRTVEAFENASLISEVIVVCRPQDREKIRTELQGLLKVTNITEGGANRQESVEKGVLQCGCCDYLAIHDGARPLISPSLIDEVCRDAMSHQNAAPAVKVKDTIKIADENRFINGTPNRDFLYQVQTPQIFAYVGYRNALQLAREQGKNFTDDCQLIENAGGKIYLSQGEYTNIKLTTPEDMAVGTAFAGGSKMKIGHGYDVHRLVENRRLILGGVEIPYRKGLLGHSDADVLLHAVADALLGAAGLPDIGRLFPDTDPQYRGADSSELLRQVEEAIQKTGCKVESLDCTVVAQQPKLSPHIEQMRKNIAAACEIPLDSVNVKATTEEGLGVSGGGEGIAAHAVCLLIKNEK